MLSLDRLKKERILKKLTHEDMATKLGITRQAYGNYESGKRDVDSQTLSKLADILEVSGDYLLGRSISKGPSEGHAYMNGGKDWTEEEKEVADAAIQAWREMKRKQREKEQKE
ncbi:MULTISPECIES: helix-turn-helix domain-containing protein [Paenibacillus]|uniref:Transcriptional regulator n=1 Tax=Paenibacillus polymyxa (strain SC2) TaxID=886882 RepID=E3E5A8_PAEPS|nr:MULTISPECIES: helix-turn-helix transcriptional regulator [Paenibacillus]ADO57468.1 transcriptional regulator [Paenibacillus polymyxa SC2]MCP3807173.1 helix-turn-helix transcriptional regulator [Paenibacillus sp. Lou8.1]WPQ55239.1 helix-turn-helix transcriptional regulator [Paenibacillus polymyxa]CCI70130.1 putative HTH-type transcriptional regulator yqaE [Paenibacillus polymyxa M1]